MLNSLKMADDGATFDIILLFGPALPDKLAFLPQSFLRAKFTTICMDEIYRANPHFGLRDIALKVVTALKKERQVIIIDELRLQATRKNLVDAIVKKVPTCRVLLVQMIPKYGYLQVLWLRQFSCASGDFSLKDDDSLKRWFDASLQNLDYQSDYVDEPKGAEGYSIHRLSFPLEVQSSYKFEIPALMFQWEGTITEMDDLKPQVIKLCTDWQIRNPVGRLIFICDGKKVSKGIVPVATENNIIKRCLSQLSEKVAQPVYAVQLTSAINSGSFNIPPHPGILAFLQKRHLLNFHSKQTCYVFDTIDHKKLAERCGIRHVKTFVALKSPDTILKGHGLTSPVPAMLRSMVIKKTENKNDMPSAPTVPLFDNRDEMKEGHICCKGQLGMKEHVFVKDRQIFCQYQNKFSTHVTPVDQEESNMPSDNSANIYETVDDKRQVGEGSLSRQNSCSTIIPDWMQRKRPRREPTIETPITGHEKHERTGSASGSGRTSRTVYVMSEREILDMAQQILLETGHEDIVKRAQSNKKRRAPD